MQQWIYTTSCWNIRGQSGWNTFSHSRGLTEEDVQELEEKCQVPPNIGSEYFPIFEHLVLSSGKKAICQTSLQGNSFYDGRPGATLTHAFIIGPEEEWPLPAVEYFGSPSFLKDLPEETKQRALYYRDHPSESVPPPHLAAPELSVLRPGHICTPENIRAALQKPEFRQGVSEVLAAIIQTEADMLPVRFTCSPGGSIDILAAMCYLLPNDMRRASWATLYRTSGSIGQYGFLLLTGTRDANAQIDTDRADGPVHPVVEQAAAQPERWCRFCVENELDISQAESAAGLFNFLYGQDDVVVTEELAKDIVQFQAAGHDSITEMELGLRVGDSPWQNIPPAVLSLLAENAIDKYQELLPLFDDACKKGWQDYVLRLLEELSRSLMTGGISPDDMLDLLSRRRYAAELWCSPRMLQRVLEHEEGEAMSLFLLRCRLKPVQTWLNDAAGQIFCRRLALQQAFWKTLAASETGISALLEAWSACRQQREVQAMASPVLVAVAAAFPAEMKANLIDAFVQLGEDELALALYMGAKSCTSARDWLLLADDCMAKHPALSEMLLQRITPVLRGGGWDVPSCCQLLEKVQKYPISPALRAEIASALASRFEAETITPELVSYAELLLKVADLEQGAPALRVHFVADTAFYHRRLTAEERQAAAKEYNRVYFDPQSPECLLNWIPDAQQRRRLLVSYLSYSLLYLRDAQAMQATFRMLDTLEQHALPVLCSSLLEKSTKTAAKGELGKAGYMLLKHLLFMGGPRAEIVLQSCAATLNKCCGKAARKKVLQILEQDFADECGQQEAAHRVAHLTELLEQTAPRGILRKIIALFSR